MLALVAMVLAFVFIALFALAACLLDRPNQIEGEEMLDRIIKEYEKKNGEL